MACSRKISINGYGNTLAFYNAQASLSNTNVLGSGPLTLSGSTLVVSNRLNLGASSVVNFILGASALTLTVKSNLTLSGAVNLSASAGFTPAAYTVFTYGGNLARRAPGFRRRAPTVVGDQLKFTNNL